MVAVQPVLHHEPDADGPKALAAAQDLIVNFFVDRILEDAKTGAAADLDAARSVQKPSGKRPPRARRPR